MKCPSDLVIAMPPDKYYFGGDDDSGYVEWSSAAMIGKGSFSIVYSARLKHVRSQHIQYSEARLLVPRAIVKFGY